MNQNNNENNNDEIIKLTLEDGSVLDCAVIAVFPVEFNGEEHSYISLLPLDKEDAEEVYLYRLSDVPEGSDADLISIEDDDEFEAVSDRFDELMDEAEFDELMNGEEPDEP